MPRQIVIQLARFGDVLQTGRLLRSLEQDGETHLCVDRSLAGLARRLHPACRVHGVAAHADARALDAGLFAENLAANRDVFADLAALDADAVYNLNHAGMNRALAALFRPEIVRGYRVRDGQPLRDRWMRMAFRWMGGGTGGRRAAPLNLVDFWGLLAPRPVPPEAVNPAAAPGGKGLGVVLAGRQARRSLPPAVLAAAVLALFEGLGGPPVYLFGSRADRGTGRELMRHLPRRIAGRVVNLAGRTDWDGLCDALTGLDALLTPDTGTMHLAARLGVPVRGLFLSSAWAWETGPYGLGHRVWQAGAACAPCAEAAPCGRDVLCLEPFRDPAFLRALARGAAAPGCARAGAPGQRGLPQGLVCLASGFDALGLTWAPGAPAGEDPLPLCSAAEEARRAALRRLLADFAAGRGHLLLPAAFGADGLASFPQGAAAEAGALLADCAGILYHEADWMLPDTTV